MTHGRLVDVQYLLECSEKSFYHPTLIRSPALIVKDGSDKSRKQDIYSVNIRLLLLTEPARESWHSKRDWLWKRSDCEILKMMSDNLRINFKSLRPW
jgi:hypothetical protein